MRLALLMAALPLGYAISRPLADEGAAEAPDTEWLGSAYHSRRDDEPHENVGSTATQGNLKAVILADSNRDGVVDVEGSTDRVPGKDSWSHESGALFLPLRVTKVFAAKDADEAGYRVTLDGVASSAKTVGLKEPIQETSWANGFIQDLFETMYASIPGSSGTIISLPIILPAPMKVYNSLAALSVAQQIRSTGIGMVTDVLPPGSNEETLDAMGNIETIPPSEFNGRNFSAGRIVMGANQTAGRVPLSLPFLQAQEMQDPLLVDSTWLEVQHVDEFLQFLPAETPLKWRVMVSDPLGAIKVLQDAQAAGRGNTSFSSRPSSETESFGTIDQLVDTELIQTNEECARRIQGTIEMLKREAGISDSDILRVPVPYIRLDKPTIPSNGDFQVGAILPNAINGLVMTNSLYVAPKQWGPLDAAGVDVLQHAVEMVYKQAGYNVDFVDDWNYHRRKGDIHCATNVFRELPGSKAASLE